MMGQQAAVPPRFSVGQLVPGAKHRTQGDLVHQAPEPESGASLSASNDRKRREIREKFDGDELRGVQYGADGRQEFFSPGRRVRRRSLTGFIWEV